MILSPGIEEQLLVLLNHGHRPTHIAIGHAPLRDDGKSGYVDARFSFANHMYMRRLVVGCVDDETHAVLAQKRDHGGYYPNQLGISMSPSSRN